MDFCVEGSVHATARHFESAWQFVGNNLNCVRSLCKIFRIKRQNLLNVLKMSLVSLSTAGKNKGFLCLGLAHLVPDALIDNLFKFPDYFRNVLSWLNVIAAVPFLWGIVLVWKKATPRKPESIDSVKPSAIKDPFSFGEMDGEIFSRLGRQADLSKIFSWVIDTTICFVALKGESGAGKTSLLRAGITYTFAKEKEKYGIIPIYWEAVPDDSVEELLRTVHIACPDEKDNLQTLNDLVDNISGSKKVIIIDQAEQLSPEKHHALFALFKNIVTQRPPYTTTWIIAFREEYASTWFDFESTLPDFHPPKHPLKVFTEEQARDNMAVLAKESGLAPDNAVLVEMINTMSDKGRVSPVEIGIGMMVLSEFYREPGGDISLGKFQDAGGMTGLLRAYIKGKFEEGMPEHEHASIQNTLLDLIDSTKSYQRLSQGKVAAELARIVALPLKRMQQNLSYLASQNVRILEKLTPQAQPDSDARYRLAHERLIPALQSLAGELLAAAERAKRLLHERYHTWVNAKQRKFLLSGKELRNVLKYRSHFNETLKPELLQYIRQSTKLRYIKVCLGILLIFSLSMWQPFNQKVLEPWKRDQRIDKIKEQFVKVEGGIFAMGDSSEVGNDDERPIHQVKLSDFQISRYEITNQQYCDFLNVHDSAKVKADVWLDISSSYCEIGEKDGRFIVFDDTKKDDAVVTVSWFGAVMFGNFMSEHYGYKPSYNVNDWSCDSSANGFRLPTEAEWEYAACGGKKSKGYRYSGSDSIDVVAWYWENTDNLIHTVGKKQSSQKTTAKGGGLILLALKGALFSYWVI